MGGFTRRGAWVTTVAGLVLITSFGGAAAGVAEVGADGAKGTVATDAAFPAEPPDDLEHMASDTRSEIAAADSFAALQEAADSDGSVRAIVTLQTRWAPGALLDDAARVSQAEAIDALQQQLELSLEGTQYSVIHEYDDLPLLALELDVPAVAGVASVRSGCTREPDLALEVALYDSVPLINADDVRNAGYDGSGEAVAILDTGVESSHTFFAGRVVDEACFSDGDCPDGSSVQYGVGSAAPCTYSSSDCLHGTHVAGIAAGWYSSTFSGVAPGANIVAVQVFSDAGGSAVAWNADIIKGLEYVLSVHDTYNVASVNLSLGGGQYFGACDYSSFKPAIDNLRAAGVATVISAGNDGWDDSVTSPGCVSTAITVASSTKSDARSYFSNAAPIADLIAPGSDIYSSVPGGWATLSGTSMAAPHVTGAWALLKSAHPDATVADILAALRRSPTQIAVTGDRSLPRIDVSSALNLLAIPLPANDAFAGAVSLVSPSDLSASTVRATTEYGEPSTCYDPDLGLASPIGGTLWYRVDPVYDTELTIDTAGSGLDTVVGLYQGSSLGSLTMVACDDDYGDTYQSRVVADIVGGQTYWIQAGGFSTSTGDLKMSITNVGDGSAAPTWPTKGLSASNVFKDRMTVSWSAASDDRAVTGYRVYLNGSLQATTSSRSFTASGLQPNHSYQFTIEAGDAGSNWTVGPVRSFATAQDFTDTDGLVFEEDIEWMSGAGITAGCNPPVNDRFCPVDPVTRGQMAAFLVRALGFTDAGSGDFFVDDDGSVFEEYIERCGGGDHRGL